MSVGQQVSLEISDEELVRRFRAAKDQAYFLMLFERHKRRVFLACRRFLGEGAAAEDAAQETFLRVYKNLDRFVGGGFSSWLLRIAKNVCIDQWRRQRHEISMEEASIGELPENTSMERSAALRLAVQKVLEEMNQLPAEQRRCLELKSRGHSYQEMAALTGLTIEAVKSHLQNGRRMLWQRLGSTLAGLE